MKDLRAIAAALDGDVCGNNVLSPGPGHSAEDRSLCTTVADGGKIIVHSFAGDDWLECRRYVESKLGRSSTPAAGRTRGPSPAIDNDRRSEFARKLWAEARDPKGSSAERYLASRKLPLLGKDLRFHHRCPFPGGERHPALLAAFRRLTSDEIVAIHRIRVDRSDLWPKSAGKAMLGPVRGTAVKLAPVTNGTLAVAEGIETALAANVLGHGPAWALGSAAGVEWLPVLPGVQRLILLAENNEASIRATRACGERWLRAGRQCTRIWPNKGADDLNDELMMKEDF
jgi:putative DNA primase/helicase